MTWLNVTLFEYGTNKKIGSVYMASHYPTVGDYYVHDNKLNESSNDKMYIVRAVTHLQDNKIALHIERYDADAEEKRWSKVAENIRRIGENVDGSEK